MLSATDLERGRYESRRKWQLDYNTGLKSARLDGLEEGRRETLIMSEIKRLHFCERILKRPETPEGDLAPLSLEALTQRADELEQSVIAQH